MTAGDEVSATRWAAALLGLGHLGLYLFYLGRHAAPERLMVSAVIEAHEAFRAAGCAFVALETVALLCYFRRFRASPAYWQATLWATLGLAGWLVLSLCTDSARHFSGVALFVAGEALAYVSAFMLTRAYAPAAERRYDYALIALAVATLALVAAYIGMYLNSDLAGCWLVEQCALGGYILTFTSFFALHDANPHEPVVDRNHKFVYYAQL